MRGICVVVDTDPNKIVQHKKLFCLGSVMQAQNFVNRLEQPEEPYDSVIEVSGAAINKTNLELWLKYFKTVHCTYGSTETTRTYIKSYKSADEFRGDMGKPVMPDIGAEIVDDQDQPVAAGVTGYIRLPKTARHVDGYLNDAVATNEHFRFGYFYPGDQGYKDTEGNLYIVGRKTSNFINIAGIKIDPSEIETVIRSVVNVKDCLLFKNEQLDLELQLSLLLVTAVEDKDSLIKEINDKILKTAGVSHIPKTVYLVDQIPLNENGKPWRTAAQKIAEKLEPSFQTFYQLTAEDN